MEPNEHSGGVISALVTAIFALSAAVGVLVRRLRKKVVNAPLAIDAGPLVKAAMEMQAASTTLAEKVSQFCARVDDYHRRTGILEDLNVAHGVRITAAEIDIQSLNHDSERQWDVIQTTRADVEKVKGKIGL